MMEYRQFVVPSDEELVDTLGFSPEVVEGESTVRSLGLTSTIGDKVLLSYDVLGRSFRIHISSGDALRLDLLRESATHLSVSAEGRDIRVRVAFEAADLMGELDVLIADKIVVQDRLLMV
jgi:hypothetical protein